jgi:hypothetical protein
MIPRRDVLKATIIEAEKVYSSIHPFKTHSVLVQPEMERGRSPLVSIPPFGRGFLRHRYDHQAIPQHGQTALPMQL